ncbi:unnamed protein product [Mytilus coruscus]|uniref:Uncharacterized protein n=1 Tax=Mytilus coruscus TaxID=42192 RepID=A0A6J8D6Z6_MYTCO|nr:unnamed protein product [Mytilus coruscus]
MCKAGRQPLQYISISDSKKRCKTPIESSLFYNQLKALGFEYGKSLTVIGDCFRSDDEFVAEMSLPSSAFDSLKRHSLHPSILDGALQTVVLCYQNQNEAETQDRPIPVKISSLRVHIPMEPNMFVIGKKAQSNSLGTMLNLFIVNSYGDIVVEVKGYEVKNINSENKQFDISDKLYHIIWTPVNIDQNTSGEIGKILSITFTSEAKRSLENVFRDENIFSVALPFNYDQVSVQELLEVLFKNIMFNPDRDQWRKTSEYKIEDQQLYINQICKLSFDEPSHRKNTFNENEVIELRSVHQESLQNLIFVPKMDTLSNQVMSPSYVKLKVTSVLCSDTWTPRIITHGIGELDPWKYNSKDGHEVILSEVSGYLENNHIDSSSTSCCFTPSNNRQTGNSKKEEFISCFPCTASNFVYIPKICVLEKTLFPLYRPGMLLEIVLYFSLLAEINDKNPLIAFVDTELSLNGRLLDCVLQTSKRNIIQFNNTMSLITALPKTTFHLILLTNNFNRLEEILSKQVQAEVKAYSFSDLVNKIMEREIRHRFPNTSLVLINYDQVLCQENLSKVMFQVRRLLSAKQTRPLFDGIEFPTKQSDITLSFKQKPCGNKNLLASHIPVVISKDRMFSKHATYIIIGGLTGLGWELLTAMASRGGGVLIPISRRGPNDQQLQNIDEVRRKYGCVIECIQADISVFSLISNAFNQIKTTFPEQAIKGIFHGAAVVDDALLPDMTEDKFDKVLSPKTIGTWNLHLLAKDLTLDFFVLHSSISSAFGNAGQTNYGAGNAFQDAIAFHRRGLGLAGQSINWGALKLGLVQKKTEEHLKSQGFPAMKETEIVQCFIHSLFINSEQIICGTIDWKTVMKISPDMIHLTSRLHPILEDLNLLDTTIIKQNKISYIHFVKSEELQTLSTRQKQTKVLKTVSQIAADTCTIELSIIQPKTTLSSLGIDSMKGMSFINSVYKYTSCKIPVITILEEDATIESIADLIFK